MATTTPNFGWAVPTSSDLVKNGATAIETLGDSIDASLVDLKGGTTGQVLKKATNTDMDFVWSADSAGMTNPMTTTGDTIYSSSGSTPARLGIGSTGNVLTVSGGVPTWAAPASGGGTTLISSTTLSGAGITLSSIPSTYKNLYLEFSEFYCNQTYAAVYIRFNGDSSAAYDWGYLGSQNTSTDFANNTQSTEIQLSSNTDNTNRWEKGSAYLQIQNYAQATVPVYFWGNGRVVQATNKKAQNLMGQYRNGSVLSSIYIYTSSGTWSGGTVKLYGVN
jgi:hypothetical protein